MSQSTSGNITLNIDGLVTDINGIRGQVAALESRRYITETWESEDKSKWYRKYSDGWVEQGIYVPLGSTDTITITLPVAMKNTYYTISVCVESTYTGAGAPLSLGILQNTKTTTGFDITSANSDIYTPRTFYICGYAAQ